MAQAHILLVICRYISILCQHVTVK